MLNNVLQEILIIFRSNSTESIEEWFNILSKQIFESNEENPIALTSFQFDVDRKILICFVEARPQRNIQVICNPYAGPRRTRNIYRMKIEPMLERARYKINYSGLTKENSLVGKNIANRFRCSEIHDNVTAEEIFSGLEGDFDKIDG